MFAQEVVSCAMRLDCQVTALSEGVVKRQIEFDEKAQSLSAMVSPADFSLMTDHVKR